MKPGKRKSLRKGARLFRQRKYTYVINLLEPQVFMFRDSWYYYHLLGMSCLYTGDYAGAYSYLRRAADLDEGRTETMLGIGAVLLRRRQLDLAIANYLDILDQHPRERRARRALQWIRKLDQPDDVVEWFESDRMRRILPPRGAYLPTPVTAAFVIAAVVAAGVFGGPSIFQAVRGLLATDLRPGSELLQLPGEQTVIADHLSTGGASAIILTSEEIEDLFAEIGALFNDSRDNLVRRELNRVALSNAEPAIKAQAELLREYLSVPDYTTMRDNFTLAEVVTDPALYDGVYVKWRGRIANLVVSDDAIRFDLLVGYESGRILDGIVPVRVPFAVLLDDGQGVEIIGRLVSVPSGESEVGLVASDVRRLAPGNGTSSSDGGNR